MRTRALLATPQLLVPHCLGPWGRGELYGPDGRGVREVLRDLRDLGEDDASSASSSPEAPSEAVAEALALLGTADEGHPPVEAAQRTPRQELVVEEEAALLVRHAAPRTAQRRLAEAAGIGQVRVRKDEQSLLDFFTSTVLAAVLSSVLRSGTPKHQEELEDERPVGLRP
uniref:Uncharacterized protein n=1 Tax=Ixodes ricinus TaxID=34613 RepID=A0A6B0UZX0_IXORI